MRFTCVQYVCICRSMTSHQCLPSLAASLAPAPLTSQQKIHIWFHHTRIFIIQTLPQLPSVLFKKTISPAMFTRHYIKVGSKWYNKEGYLVSLSITIYFCLCLDLVLAPCPLLWTHSLAPFLPICFHPWVRVDQDSRTTEEVSKLQIAACDSGKYFERLQPENVLTDVHLSRLRLFYE
jgi:hypothetical protein